MPGDQRGQGERGRSGRGVEASRRTEDLLQVQSTDKKAINGAKDLHLWVLEDTWDP